MTIEEVRNGLIADMENINPEDLDYYCTANSSEMFACIFDYKPFDKANFNL